MTGGVVPSFRVVALLLFGSGFSALVYQSAWSRMFRLTFGASTAASAAVLAIFLGGLGLGGALLGRRVERSPRPLVFYGNLELAISALAALSPLLSSAMHGLYLRCGGSQALGLFGSTLLRLLMTAIIVGPAAVLMGGTLPAAARAVVSEADPSRRSLARLYALNTVGAVAGSLLGPLILFGLIGNQFTLWGAACINALVGVCARAFGRSLPALPATQPESTGNTSDAESGAELEPNPPNPRLIYAVAALVGFAFLALELVWYRILTPVLGGSSLTFGLILACALAGIGIGGYLFSVRSEHRPATLQLLSLTLGAEAVCVLLPFAWGDDLAFVAAHLRGMANLGYGYLLLVWTFVAAVVVMPASIVSGYQFPLLFSLLGRGRHGVARQVGTAYAFNTIGTLSGSLLAGFVIIPTFGCVPTWRALALCLALGGVLCAVFAGRKKAQLRSLVVPVLAGLLALALSTSSGPGAAFRQSAVGAGRVDISKLSRNQILAQRRSTERSIVWQRDGVESTIGINVKNGMAFIVNGKSDGSVVGDRGTQAFLGLLPAALHGHVKTAFVVGLGTGMTAGLLGRVPGVQSVEVAELEPAVFEVARRAAPVNGNVLANQKVHILNGDGRELLLTSDRRYDLIVSEPSNPYRAGVASLFTREFYLAAASRMDKKGIFAQWLQGYEIDATTISTAIRTLREVFPHVSLWAPEGQDLILIGSFAPQVIDADRLRQDLSDPAYALWMRRAWGMEGAEGLIAHHVVPPRLLDRLANSLPAPINTDDVNVLEFAFARSVGDGRYQANSDVFNALKGDDYRPQVQGQVDWKLVEDYRRRVGWEGYRGAAASPKAKATIAGCSETMQQAAQLWPGTEPAGDLIESWVLGSILAMKGDDAAYAEAERLQREGFVAEALLIRSRVAQARKEFDAAADLLVQVFEQLRKTPLPLCDASERALSRAGDLAVRYPARALDLFHAIARGPMAIYKDEALRQAAMMGIASSLPGATCAEGLGSQRSQPEWERTPLTLRARCLRQIAAPDAQLAEADLLDFLAHEPQSFGVPELRGRGD